MSEFYSIFIEKTHTIIDMEVGQEMILKIILQHYNGIIFAEKFERLPLKAVVSHPNVANVELIDFNSKLKLKSLFTHLHFIKKLEFKLVTVIIG